MENIFELVDKKLKALREAEAKKLEPINTSDEKNLKKTLIQTTALINKLNTIDQVIELDGLFEIILEQTNLTNVNKQTIMNALKNALNDMSSDEPTITTKKEK